MPKQIPDTYTISVRGQPGAYTVEADGPGNVRVEPQAFAWLPSAEQSATLAALGPSAAAPLVAAIRTNDPFVQYHAAVALRQIGNESVVPHLIRPALDPRMEPRVSRAAAEALRTISGSVPTPTTATEVLVAECRALLQGPTEPPTFATERTEWWEWKNEDPRGPRRTEVSSPMAAATEARRLAEAYGWCVSRGDAAGEDTLEGTFASYFGGGR